MFFSASSLHTQKKEIEMNTHAAHIQIQKSLACIYTFVQAAIVHTHPHTHMVTRSSTSFVSKKRDCALSTVAEEQLL